tara:strand:+ start:39 stop:1073 length:1035 start_codon:yes stop_codon:yes gene_type:complete
MISATKTGGHVFPAVEVGKYFKSNNHNVFFFGSGSEIELKAIDGKNFKYFSQSIKSFRGKGLIGKFSVLFSLPLYVLRSIRIIKKNKIDAFIGFGGFATIPISIASYLCKIPVYTHEQNSVQGSANSLISNFAKINFLGMKTTKEISRSKFVGNPIRKDFIFSPKNISSNSLNIYVTGGSQGARYINEVIPGLLMEAAGIKNLNIRHQCGRGQEGWVKNIYKKNLGFQDVEVKEFFQSPSKNILWSDFVITRCGALSLSEISSMNRGMIMIPLPTSIDNHQLYNAKFFAENNMGIIHEQNNSVRDLQLKFNKIVKEEIFLSWNGQNMIDHSKAAKKIYEEITKL